MSNSWTLFPVSGHQGGFLPKKAGGEAQNVHGAAHRVGGETRRVHGEAHLVRGETHRVGGAARPAGGETRRVPFCDSPARGHGSPAAGWRSAAAVGRFPRAAESSLWRGHDSAEAGVLFFLPQCAASATWGDGVGMWSAALPSSQRIFASGNSFFTPWSIGMKSGSAPVSFMSFANSFSSFFRIDSEAGSRIRLWSSPGSFLRW